MPEPCQECLARRHDILFLVILRGFSLEGSLRFFGTFVPQNDKILSSFFLPSSWAPFIVILSPFSCHPIPLSRHPEPLFLPSYPSFPSSWAPFLAILSPFYCHPERERRISLRFFGTFVPQNDRKRKDQKDGKRNAPQNDKILSSFFSCHPIPLSLSSWAPLPSSWAPLPSSWAERRIS